MKRLFTIQASNVCKNDDAELCFVTALLGRNTFWRS